MSFLKRIRFSGLMKQLLYLMVIVGIIMGITFPYFISGFVVIEINYSFRIACITAGFIVGLINFITIKKTLERSLHPIISNAEEISKGKFDTQLKYRSESNDIFSQLSKSIVSMAKSLEEMHEELKKQANIDFLTGLPNRFLFKDRLDKALDNACCKREILAVFFLDLDRFKYVNDTLGHTAGDELLRSVASRLKVCAREEDTLARMGGDEFNLLITKINQVQTVRDIAKRILEQFERPFTFTGHKLDISVSIGIAIYPLDGEDAETIIKNADIAMYRAKKQEGSNYQLYCMEGVLDKVK